MFNRTVFVAYTMNVIFRWGWGVGWVIQIVFCHRAAKSIVRFNETAAKKNAIEKKNKECSRSLTNARNTCDIRLRGAVHAAAK